MSAPSLSTKAKWREIAGRTLDFLIPPACLACDGPVGANHTLCPECWNRVHFITRPFCAACGVPFDVPVENTTLCGGCITEPPHFGAARAAMLYDGAGRNLALRFKHGDRTHAARALASWMRRAGEEFWEQTDLILPVPLHRWRLFKRRYNQAALLAQNLAHIGKKPFLPDTLRRFRPTPSQGHLNRKERHANVKGAFTLKPGHEPVLKGKTVLLVDDVLTTGATANECSRLLMNSGAKAVNVLVLARVRGGLST